MTEAALSLGANLGDRARNLREAVRALSPAAFHHRAVRLPFL